MSTLKDYEAILAALEVADGEGNSVLDLHATITYLCSELESERCRVEEMQAGPAVEELRRLRNDTEHERMRANRAESALWRANDVLLRRGTADNMQACGTSALLALRVTEAERLLIEAHPDYDARDTASAVNVLAQVRASIANVSTPGAVSAGTDTPSGGAA